MEREDRAAAKSEAKALAGAGRGVGERSEVGRGDQRGRAKFANG